MSQNREPAALADLRRTNRRRVFWMFVVLFLFGSWSLVGIGMVFAPSKPSDVEMGKTCIWFGLFSGDLPLAWMLWRFFALRSRLARLDGMRALASTATRLPLATVADEFRVDHRTAREIILDAVATGTISGRLDLEQGLFISSVADQRVHDVASHCPSCGAEVKVVQAPGEIPTCPFCNAPLAAAAS